MNYQSSGRNLRSKGFKVKRAFQFALLLAICIWLYKKKGNGGRTDSKISEGHGFVILGRKGNAGWLSNWDQSESDNVKLVEKKEDGGGGDDELDITAKEKAEEESFHMAKEYHPGNVEAHEERKYEMDQRRQYEESPNNGNKQFDIDKGMFEAVSFSQRNIENLLVTVSNSATQGEEKHLERQVGQDEEDTQTQVNDLQNTKEDTSDTPLRVKDELVGSYKENDEVKEAVRIKKKIEMHPIVLENATVNGQSELVNGVLGFQDENGFPEDGNDFVKSEGIELNDDPVEIIKETISGRNNQRRIMETMPIEVEEVALNKNQVLQKLNLNVAAV